MLGFFKRLGTKIFGKFSSFYSEKKVKEKPRVFDGEKYHQEERANAYRVWKWSNFGVKESFYADSKNAWRSQKERWDLENEKILQNRNRYQHAKETIDRRRIYSVIFDTSRSLDSLGELNLPLWGNSGSVGCSKKMISQDTKRPISYKSRKEVTPKPFDPFDTSVSFDTIRIDLEMLARNYSQGEIDLFAPTEGYFN